MMKSAELSFDVCVIGGGPAGSTIAHRLSRLGHRVCLVEKRCFPRSHVGVSLPQTIWPLFEELGIREKVLEANFLPSSAARIRWGQVPSRVNSGVDRPGLQVDRGRFDKLLLEAAVQVGVTAFTSATPRRAEDDSRGNWKIPAAFGPNSIELHARFLVDAAGRSGYLPGPRRALLPKTIAICGYWFDLMGLSNETIIEDGAQEWYWGAPLPGGRFLACVFIDSSRYIAVGGRHALARFYRNLLADSSLLSRCLRGRLIQAPSISDATCAASLDPIGANWIKVGDSSFALDPLSSQGVQTAIANSLMASAVVNTILRNQSGADLARTFYRQRHDELVQNHQSHSLEIYRRQATIRTANFWSTRGRQTHKSDQERPLPAAGSLTHGTILRVSKDIRIIDIGVLQNNVIVEQSAIHQAHWKRPLAFVDEVSAAELISCLKKPMNAARLVDLWSRGLPRDRAWQILELLWHRGVVCAAD